MWEILFFLSLPPLLCGLVFGFVLFGASTPGPSALPSKPAADVRMELENHRQRIRKRWEV